MKTQRKERASVTIDLGDLGRWSVDVDAAILRRLQEQAKADSGRFPLADKDAAKNFGRHLGDVLSTLIRREFAGPTPAQVKYARVIAEKLGLEVPAETWGSKILLSAFIGAHKDRLEQAEEEPTGPRRIS